MLALCLPKLSPYELPQIVAQIPPPPMNVPMPIWKALATEGKKIKLYIIYYVVNMNLLILHGLDCSRNTTCPITPYIQPLKEKEDLVVHSINRKKRSPKQETVASTSEQTLNI